MVRKINPLAGGWGKRAIDNTHQRAFETKATRALATVPWQGAAWRDDIARRVIERAIGRRALPPDVATAMRAAVADIIRLETSELQLPDAPPDDPLQAVGYRARLQALLTFQDQAERLLERWIDSLGAMLRVIADAVPPAAMTAPAHASIVLSAPLVALVEKPTQLVTDIVAGVLALATDDPAAVRPGAVLARRCQDKLLEVSKLSPEAARKNHHRLVQPRNSGLQGVALVEAYIPDPLRVVLTAPIPLPVSDESRFEHCQMVSGSGGGKTTTLEHIIVNDLLRPPNQVPATIVIDSQGRMLQRIARLALFAPGGALAGRLLYIDGTDIEYPPALNPFAVNRVRLATYDMRTRLEVLNGVIQLFDFLFASLLAADPTQRQQLVMRYTLRLMLEIENSTLETFRELLEEHAPLYEQHKHKLDTTTRQFFENELPKRAYRDVRDQVLRRLWSVLEDPTLQAMFTARENRVDLFDAINNGMIILVDTAAGVLKGERSSLLGRTFITLILQAVLERAAIPEHRLRPAFLYLDEAAEYFDHSNMLPDFLRQGRKYKAGLMLVHHNMDQIPSAALRGALGGNTTIKIAGSVTDDDARALAPNMKTTPAFITEHTKADTGTAFAVHVRHLTPHAVTLRIPFGTLDAQPRMSDTQFAQFIAANRARLAVRPANNDAPIVTPTDRAAPPRATDGTTSAPREFGKIENVTIQNLTLPALLDTGAQVSLIIATEARQCGTPDKPRLAFTIAAAGATLTWERPVTGTRDIQGAHGTTKTCAVVPLAVTLEDVVHIEQFAVTVEEEVPAQAVLLGDTFFAALPFPVRIAPLETMLIQQRRRN